MLGISRLAVWLFLWQHRHEILGWATFSVRAAQRIRDGDTEDVKTEARLRMALTADRRTRNHPELGLEVRGGVAHLRGEVPVEVHDAAVEIASGIDRIRRVRDEMAVRRRR